MQAGRLDRRVDIQSYLSAQDEFGQEVGDWTTIGERVAASVVPVSGDERFAASQFVGRRVIEVRIRYAERFENLNVLHRIVYPAQALGSPTEEPDEQNTYDIKDVREIGRREGLQIFAVSRSEVPSA